MTGQRSNFTRRDFLQSTAVGGAMALAAPAFLRAGTAGDKLNVAIIGCGGRGTANLDGVSGKQVDPKTKAVKYTGENIVALCDVHEDNLNKAAQEFPQAKKFRDFRKLYDEANLFDAVVISTPEHCHAFATMPALQLGKHVYCEKPLTHSVWEARVIREAATKSKVATQLGTQIHAGDNFRRVVELIQANVIGPVREVHVWVSRARGRQTPEEAARHRDPVTAQDRPTESMPVPAGLDWDLWLGPASARPFHDVYVPGPKWYRWWDFGGGTMSDLGSHWNDLPFWALNLDFPLTVEASGPLPHPELAPASMTATYEFGPRGNRPAVKLYWYQGTYRPELLLEKKIPNWGDGVLFVGESGMVLSDYYKHILLPEDRFKEFQHPEQSIPNSIGHYEEWTQACKTGSSTTCNFGYAGRVTETNHLGNIAFRIGKKLLWDAAKLTATNAPEAAPLIRRDYRQGWSLA
ncbi:MAG: Gfo/Idh/MocA family oxidoreductase [Pirellulales bacterium]|nr:Gfo/Idh/MocA family oxidoreductase [Pirellulales bacterium]